MDLIRQRQQRLDDLTYRLERSQRQTLEQLRRRWETVAAAVRHYDVRRVLAGMRGELAAGTAALAAGMRNLLLQYRVRAERMGRALEALSPLAILERGYALVFDDAGQLVKDAAQVKAGDEIAARVARGEIRATVKQAAGPEDTRREQEG
jgi:exodeoxyribonuclease VII large subunit